MYRLSSNPNPNGKKSDTSYILISDRARKDATPNHLNFISPRLALTSTTGNPFIAIHLDLRIKKNEATFSITPNTDDGKCLRIYAPGVNDTTYPFLARIKRSAEILESLVNPPAAHHGSSPNHLLLSDRVHYGDTCKKGHMLWRVAAPIPSE